MFAVFITMPFPPNIKATKGIAGDISEPRPSSSSRATSSKNDAPPKGDNMQVLQQTTTASASAAAPPQRCRYGFPHRYKSSHQQAREQRQQRPALELNLAATVLDLLETLKLHPRLHHITNGIADGIMEPNAIAFHLLALPRRAALLSHATVVRPHGYSVAQQSLARYHLGSRVRAHALEVRSSKRQAEPSHLDVRISSESNSFANMGKHPCTSFEILLKFQGSIGFSRLGSAIFFSLKKETVFRSDKD